MATEAPEKPKEAEEEKPKVGRASKVADEITWGIDHKNAQYARLVVSNYVRGNLKKYGLKKPEEAGPNEIEKSVLEKAWKDLVTGNMLDGKDGITFIQEHTANGSTTGRGLTEAYASEVRPYIRQGKIADHFGRRGGLTEEEKNEREAKRLEAKEKREADAKERREEREKKAKENKEKREKEAQMKKDQAEKDKAAADKSSQQADKGKAA